MFFICKETCMCTAPQSGDPSNPTLLYCFGEVVIPKTKLREDDPPGGTKAYTEYFSEYYLQIVQLAVILCLVVALVTILLVIKKDLLAIDRVVRRIVRVCEGGGEARPSKEEYSGEWGQQRPRTDDISIVSDVS